MTKTMLLGAFLLLITSCNEKREKLVENDTNYVISTENWPKKLVVNSKASAILYTWGQFEEFDEAMDALYTVENTDDLRLVIEDLIDKQTVLKKSKYPIEFDISQIKSRQKVVHTFILKTKGNLEYNIDTQETIVDLLKANNAMRNQFNVITNNTLDINTLIEED